MIATCQFCQVMLESPAIAEDASAQVKQWAYKQLSMLVAAHMASAHAPVMQ